MKRREFLKSIAVAAVIPTLPTIDAPCNIISGDAVMFLNGKQIEPWFCPERFVVARPKVESISINCKV